jgi:hypothetical protein
LFSVSVRHFKKWRSLIFVGCFLFITLIQIFFTRQATGPHHAAVLAPLWLIPVAVGLSRAFDYKSVYGIYMKGIAVLAIGMVFAHSLFIDVAYLKGFHAPVRNPNWDIASYELARWLKENDDHAVICVDWGLGTVIDALSNGKLNVQDRWPTFKDGLSRSDAEFIERNILSQKTFFVVHAKGKENFPETRSHFFETARNYGWDLNKDRDIKSQSGDHWAEIYSIRVNPK